MIRRITITANHTVSECSADETGAFRQLQLFEDYGSIEKEQQEEKREKKMQQAVLDIKKKYGKNAIIKGMNLEEGATTLQRNDQIGGHKA